MALTSLPKLNALTHDQVLEALANAGYECRNDDNIRGTAFLKLMQETTVSGNTFIYTITYDYDGVVETGWIYVHVNEEGEIVAEF
jgi:hypothetical protein